MHNLTDCTADQFRCDSGQCVTVHSMCDGITYCLDGSDQANCCEYQRCNYQKQPLFGVVLKVKIIIIHRAVERM